VAIELPGAVADFLNFIGISWPNVNEDKVREFGQRVAQFAGDLQNTHQGATGTIQELGNAYQGQSYQQLFATWGRMSDAHMTELLDGCHVVSGAMDVAADVIVGMKLEAIGQLVALAAEFVADQAAAVATFGLAEAGLVLIEEEGQQLVRFLEQELLQYVEGQIINAAVAPLIGKVEQAVEGLVYKEVAAALGESGSFQINPDQVMSYAQTFRQQADSFGAQADNFTATAGAMDFE
jgi:uncharacterized protein YukE